MKPAETVRKHGNSIGSDHSTHARNSYTKVLDGRKQPIRGLWERNGRFYAQLKVEDPETAQKKVRRIPLVDKDGKALATVAQAKAEFERLKVNRADNALPSLRRTPKFSAYADAYLAFIKSGEGTKRPGTLKKEEYTLNKWKAHLGEIRLDKIKKIHITDFIAKRKEAGIGNRTANLDVITLRNVLNKAIDDGWLTTLPTQNLRRLPTATPKRSLFATADLEKLCNAALSTRPDDKGSLVPVTKNAQLFVDYVKFMAYCGARRNEALKVRWADVDFTQLQVTIRGTKNGEDRVVDFNPALKTHLLEMARRRAPDSQFLFPSPQRGEKDIPARNLRESLILAREAAKLPGVGFHDLRHHFISYAVMSGVDYMTIAAWVGHKDGGVLIGKVYGHLANEHRQRQAAKLTFAIEPAKPANEGSR